MIISISGLAGAGKDTIADILIKKYQFKRIAMADCLKEIVASVMNIPLETFHNVNLKDKPFIDPYTFDNSMAAHLAFELQNLGYNIEPSLFNSKLGEVFETPRDALVYIGTDVCRNLVDEQIWLTLTMNKIKKTEGHIIVTDSRFQNERDALSALGAIKMFVDRPTVSENFDFANAHKSELDQLNDIYDVYVINDRSKNLLELDIDMWYTARVRML